MERAVNPKTGEVLFLVEDQWVKPTQTAINPKTGENAFLINNEWQTMPGMPKAGGTERTLGEALVTDPLAGLLSGTGTAVQSPGQLKQLVTGEEPAKEKPKGTLESLAQTLLPFGVDLSKIPEKVLEKLTPTMPSLEGITGAAVSPFQKIQPVGEELKAFGEKQKSTGLKAREKVRDIAIDQAEGFLPEAGAAIWGTLKDPALLSNFLFEQIPNFAGTLGGGAISKQMVKSFFTDATEKTLGKVGVAGAVATGGAMQAGDIGSDTYQTIYDRLVKEGTLPDEAHQIALEKGRMAAAQAGAISIASSFIPGGKALERRFLTDAGKKAGFKGVIPGAGNIAGEIAQESTEEGGGKYVGNVQAAQVFPDINVMKGVGSAAGLGALGGGMFGGLSNLPSMATKTPEGAPTVPPPTVPPPTVPPEAGGPTVPPGATPLAAVPLEAQLEETPAAVRLFELQKALQEVDKAFQAPDLTADDFSQLNAIAAQIRTQIAQVQSGQAVTPVTPPTLPVEEPAVTAVTPEEPVDPKKSLIKKLPNDPAIEAEGLAIADEIEKLGNKQFAEGARSNIQNSGGFTTPEKLDFYKEKLVEAKQKAGEAEVMPKETFNIDNYLPSGNKAEVKRFKDFLPNAPDEVKALAAKSNQYLQKLTDKINNLGYKVIDVDPRAPAEAIELKNKISGIAGSTFRYVKDAEHIAKNNRFADPEKMAKTAETLANDFIEADRLLGVEAAKPQASEVVQEPVQVPVAKSTKEQKIETNKARQADKKAKTEKPKQELKADVVIDDEGEKLSFPLVVDMANKGYKVLGFDNPRTYENKGGVKYRTIEKDGVRLAFEANQVLFSDPKYPNRSPQLGYGDSNEIVWHFLGVDPKQRKQGKATQAIKDFMEVADKNGYTVYGEPAQLEKEGMTAQELSNFYSKFGFKPSEVSDKVIIREPGAKAKAEPKAVKEEKPAETKTKIEDIVSPETAASMKEIEFQNKLIKANNEKTITNNQFSRLFNLYQNGKTPQADAQLEKMLEKKEKKAKAKEEFEEEHIEGKTSEPVTSKTIEESIDKAASKVDYNKIKTAVKNQFDQAIKRAKIPTEKEWTTATIDANSYVTIDIPGDGKFKVKNNVERLKELQTKIANAVVPKVAKEPSGPSSGAIEAFKSMVDDKDMENAIEYAKLKGLDPKTVKLTPAQRTIVDKYLKNPAEFDRQEEAQKKSLEEEQDRQAKEQEKRIADRLELDQEREEKARFKAVLDTTLRSTLPQLKADIAKNKISSMDAAQILEVIPKLPEGTVKSYVTKELKKIASPAEGTFYNNFDPNFTEENFNHSKDDVRKEKIKEQAVTSRKLTTTVKRIADMGSDIASQYELNRLANIKKLLTQEIEAMKQPKTLPEDVVARAAKERAEFQRSDGLEGLSPEATAVIETLYKKYPDILNGLKLSVRTTERRGVSGSFDPVEKLVTVYKSGISAIFGGANEKQAKTMRHEITHSLEQMMDSDAKKALVNAWAKSFGKAIEKYKDEAHQEYFQAVMDFIENPNESTYRKATNLIPSYDMYQYINPSEFWAVNAEPLLNAQLGGAWTRFTKAVKGLWEAIKSVFGFDNRYAVHREFNRIMSGDQKRISKQMLVDYLDQSGISKKFINNIDEELNLIEDLNFPEVVEHEKSSMKDMAIAGYRQMQDWGKEFGDNPGKTATKNLISASDAITQQRIENVWFAAGLDKRDQSRYKGQIRTADGQMAASIAIKNAIHSAHIATQVITQGALEYSQALGQFVAASSPTSMANVVKLQYALKKKLGKKVALQVVNAYFIGKRSRSIQNEFLNASSALQTATESNDFAAMADAQSDYNSVKTAYGKIPKYFRQLDADGKPMYETIYDDNGKAVDRIPILNDEAIDRAIDMEKLHPELAEMLKNWTSVNKNMLDMLAFSGRISKKTAEKLKSIKDYVPWYRIMDDQEDIHNGKLMSNYPGGPKRFKAGETERDIDNVVESMIHNVVMMTRSTTKTFAINRVISEYGQRYEDGPKKGKLMVFPSEGRDAEGTRIASFIGGRRVVTNIPDNLVADSVLGLIAAPFTFPLQSLLGAASNGFRRAITFTPWFQVKQLIIDAPTAAWVSGVRNPFKLWAGCFSGFVNALEIADTDPVVQILRNAGVGGYQSFHRSARKEREIALGLLERSNYAAFLSAIDKVGDASDLSQRVSVYKNVLAESGDPALALLQASDIIDFQKHGKGRLAQVMRTTVTFMQAYATQLDALAQASIGGNLKGKARSKAAQQFLTTGLLLGSTTLLYAFMAGADDDYWELDDQTRLRNFYIPGSKKATGHHILIPMTTSAAFFFKAVPELVYSKVVSEGTKNEMDARRVWKALGTVAADALLGPTPVPTGAKPIAEIVFNHDFFTGSNVVPKGLEGLDSAEQYNSSTSNLGHAVSKLSGGALNPIQADHLMRGMGGSIATLSMYFSNLAFPEDRPAPELKQNPIIGNLVAPEVSRKNEELFYDLREKATGKYKTYQSMLENDKFDEADKFYDKNQGLIDAYEYVSSMDTDLKEINKEVRRLGKSVDKTLTPKGRTTEINELKRLKSEILDSVTEFRKEAGF